MGNGVKFTIGRMLLESLRQAGARELFGIPGDFVIPLFKVIESWNGLPLYTLSHEPGVGFAADGAARSGCRLSVAVVTYGAGALNMVNPVAASYAEQVPVVVVSGGPGVGEQESQLLLHHQAKRLGSQYRMFQEITCAQTRLSDPATASQEVARVLGACLAQSRPVYIEVPRDLVNAACAGPTPLPPRPQAEPDALEACVDEVLNELKAANNPVLMVGVEIRRMGLESRVARLARLLDIPVVTSFMGRGLLADQKLNLRGTYLGVAGDDDVTDLVEHSDVPFLLGVILSDTNLGASRRRLNIKSCIVAGSGQVSLGYHVYPEIPLADFVDGVLARLEGSMSIDEIPSNRGGGDAQGRLHHERLDRPVTSDDVAEVLNGCLVRTKPFQLVADVGDALFVAMDVQGVPLAAPGYYASMGYAVPAGLGIQAATGVRPVILVGDGAFEMTGWELGHCSRHGWDPIVIVLNNSGWEMLRAFEPDAQFNNLCRWKFGDLANDLGGHGVRVHTHDQLVDEMCRALAQRGKFQLIDVMLPRGSMSRRMQKFVNGISRRNDTPAVPV